jgi:hypothetical protein
VSRLFENITHHCVSLKERAVTYPLDRTNLETAIYHLFLDIIALRTIHSDGASKTNKQTRAIFSRIKYPFPIPNNSTHIAKRIAMDPTRKKYFHLTQPMLGTTLADPQRASRREQPRCESGEMFIKIFDRAQAGSLSSFVTIALTALTECRRGVRI